MSLLNTLDVGCETQRGNERHCGSNHPQILISTYVYTRQLSLRSRKKSSTENSGQAHFALLQVLFG